jgi:uncharacterized membrane protein HdeD (DUF308 family)
MLSQDDIETAKVGQLLGPYWSAFIVRGIVLIGFGIFFIFFPAASWITTSIVFGSLSLADAAFNIIKACVVTCCIQTDNKCSILIMFLMSAACSSVIGFIAILDPAATAEALLLLLALWFIFIGIAQFWMACLMASDAESQNSFCLGFIAVVYVVAGVTFIMDLEGNVGFFILLVGLSLVLFGTQMIYFGLSLKRLYKDGGYTALGEGQDTMDV